MRETIIHKGCRGELVEIGKCTTYTFKTEAYKCQACGAEVDFTDGGIEFPGAAGRQGRLDRNDAENRKAGEDLLYFIAICL